MRTIKFRAFEYSTQKMHYPFIVGAPCNSEGAKFAIMQYIGMDDMNGKEIYEGDIVRIPDGYGGDYRVAEHYCKVKWGCTEFYVDSPSDESWSDYEVVGNKYEHPSFFNDLENKRQIAAAAKQSKRLLGVEKAERQMLKELKAKYEVEQ